MYADMAIFVIIVFFVFVFFGIMIGLMSRILLNDTLNHDKEFYWDGFQEHHQQLNG